MSTVIRRECPAEYMPLLRAEPLFRMNHCWVLQVPDRRDHDSRGRDRNMWLIRILVIGSSTRQGSHTKHKPDTYLSVSRLNVLTQMCKASEGQIGPHVYEAYVCDDECFAIVEPWTSAVGRTSTVPQITVNDLYRLLDGCVRQKMYVDSPVAYIGGETGTGYYKPVFIDFTRSVSFKTELPGYMLMRMMKRLEEETSLVDGNGNGNGNVLSSSETLAVYRAYFDRWSRQRQMASDPLPLPPLPPKQQQPVRKARPSGPESHSDLFSLVQDLFRKTEIESLSAPAAVSLLQMPESRVKSRQALDMMDGYVQRNLLPDMGGKISKRAWDLTQSVGPRNATSLASSASSLRSDPIAPRQDAVKGNVQPDPDVSENLPNAGSDKSKPRRAIIVSNQSIADAQRMYQMKKRTKQKEEKERVDEIVDPYRTATLGAKKVFADNMYSAKQRVLDKRATRRADARSRMTRAREQLEEIEWERKRQQFDEEHPKLNDVAYSAPIVYKPLANRQSKANRSAGDNAPLRALDNAPSRPTVGRPTFNFGFDYEGMPGIDGERNEEYVEFKRDIQQMHEKAKAKDKRVAKFADERIGVEKSSLIEPKGHVLPLPPPLTYPASLYSGVVDDGLSPSSSPELYVPKREISTPEAVRQFRSMVGLDEKEPNVSPSTFNNPRAFQKHQKELQKKRADFNARHPEHDTNIHSAPSASAIIPTIIPTTSKSRDSSLPSPRKRRSAGDKPSLTPNRIRSNMEKVKKNRQRKIDSKLSQVSGLFDTMDPNFTIEKRKARQARWALSKPVNNTAASARTTPMASTMTALQDLKPPPIRQVSPFKPKLSNIKDTGPLDAYSPTGSDMSLLFKTPPSKKSKERANEIVDPYQTVDRLFGVDEGDDEESPFNPSPLDPSVIEKRKNRDNPTSGVLTNMWNRLRGVWARTEEKTQSSSPSDIQPSPPAEPRDRRSAEPADADSMALTVNSPLVINEESKQVRQSPNESPNESSNESSNEPSHTDASRNARQRFENEYPDYRNTMLESPVFNGPRIPPKANRSADAHVKIGGTGLMELGSNEVESETSFLRDIRSMYEKAKAKGKASISNGSNLSGLQYMFQTPSPPQPQLLEVKNSSSSSRSNPPSLFEEDLDEKVVEDNYKWAEQHDHVIPPLDNDDPRSDMFSRQFSTASPNVETKTSEKKVKKPLSNASRSTKAQTIVGIDATPPASSSDGRSGSLTAGSPTVTIPMDRSPSVTTVIKE